MMIKSKKELFTLLTKELNSFKEPVAIQAGHFALIEKNRELLPTIFQDIKDKELKNSVKSHLYMGHFPLDTWKMGVGLAKYGLSKKKIMKLLILVNDWQWVPKVDFGADNTLRDSFYKLAKLPLAYQKILKDNNISENIILPLNNKNGKVNNKLFFSESKLRNQFDNYYAASCDLENSCAQEYVPLLLQLSKEGIKLLISFIPITCKLPINMGSLKAKQSLGVDMKIINIFASGIFKNNFWENIEVDIF